jgi:hypothetical protein
LKLSITIIVRWHAFVKGVRARFWLARERRALRVLARSWRYVTPTQRHRRAAHSEAYRKLTIIPIRRAQLN